MFNRVYLAHTEPTGRGREHRAAPRIKLDCPIELHLEASVGNGRIVDLSTTGAAISHDGDVDLGEVIPIRFSLNGQSETRPIACAGLVRGLRKTSTGSIYGLEFHNLSADDRKFLATHIRWVRAGGEIAEAREHWSHQPEPGSASVVSSSVDPDRRLLRWIPGFGTLFAEIAGHILDNDNVFVPVVESGLFEGEVLYLEIVPPQSHVMFRSLVEVTWVQTSDQPGVGLRLPTLTPFDKEFLQRARASVAQPMTIE